MKSGSNLKNEDVMKKVLYMVMGGLLNAMCFSACNSDLLNTVGPEANEQADGKVTVAAIIVNEDDTKIALGDDTGKSTKVYWSPDDAIALVNGEERYVFERSDDKSESQTAEFSYDSKSGNLPSIQTAGLKFVYPCIEPASYAKQPGTKEGIGDYIGMEASVPAGVSEYEGIRLTFEHSAAIVKLVLNNDNFKNKKVTVRLYADGLMPEDNMIATEPIDADASGSVTAYIAIPASGIALKNCTIYASTDAGVYETSLSDKTLSAGRLYRISKNNLVESDSPISAKLPSGTVFNSAVEKFLDDNPSLKRIRFIAASSTTGTQIGTCNAYMIANGDWLEIHTPALEFRSYYGDFSKLFKDLSGIIEIDFGCSLNTSDVIYMDSMFAGCSSLKYLDLSSFNTSNVKRMQSMFYNCTSLTELDLSGFDTAAVLDMSSMFSVCSSLTSLDLSNFETSAVGNMKGMFNKCTSLDKLDLSSFDTSSVTDMSSMFNHCTGMKELDLSSFNTSNVTTMSHMFYNANSMTDLDLSSFNTSNVINMRCMFLDCSSLSDLDLNVFDTSKVTDMFAMFNNCSSLKTLSISAFNTANVTDMSWMFSSCTSLKHLDLSSWGPNSLTTMYCMFFKCESLMYLDVTNFNTESVTDMEDLFYHCYSLTLLDLTSFNFSKVKTFDSMFSLVGKNAANRPIDIIVTQSGYNILKGKSTGIDSNWSKLRVN